MDAPSPPSSSPPLSLEFLTNARDTKVHRDLINVAGNHTVNQTINHIHNPLPTTQLQEKVQNALYDVIARNAMHDGDQRTGKLDFHPGTRKAQRTAITSWMLDPQRSECILLLMGVAGTGKSALSKRVADDFHNREVEGLLVASFFFLKEDPTRNHPGKFAATIAYRLAVSLPEVGERIGVAIVQDRTLLTAEINRQWAELVVKPVKEVITSTLPAIILIDGLDQCGTAEDQHQILNLISSCGPDFPIAFIITSCPELRLVAAFEENLGHAGMNHRVIELGDSEETRTEMKVFLDHAFSGIRKKHPTAFSLDEKWPDEQTITKILDWASGRYLLLSMVVQSVRSSDDPRAALQEALEKAPTNKETMTPPKYSKLVIAVDIGTTYSGVSYSILDSHLAPKIRCVTRFPGQSGSGGDPRIPSVVIYDRFGNVKAVGAEAENPALRIQIEDENWFKAYWFKLHLRPKELAPIGSIKEIPPLPPNKTVTMVFADFISHIVRCTQEFIIDSHTDGIAIWESPREFIFTHPNGWGGPQQFQMREAAVMAGIIQDSADGRDSIHFLTEGEACLHYCIVNNILPRNLTTRDGVLIIDAGGGTIDSSTYRKRQENEATYEEITIPQCFLQGSVIVTQRAHSRLEMYLAGSKYRDDIPGIVSSFDKTTKITFKDVNQMEYTQFGSRHDNDKDYNIRNGTLKLNGSTVASFFEPSIKCMESVISKSHLEHEIKTVVLVGGFAANEWVFKSLKATFDNVGVSIYRPDHHTAKAVADGAISYLLGSHVKARISRCAFGAKIWLIYDPKDPEHVLRKSKLKTYNDGSLCFPDAFDITIPKNTRVTEEQQYRRSYGRTGSTFEGLVDNQTPSTIYGYFGELARPEWINENPNDYRLIGKVPFDTTGVRHLIQKEVNSSGDVSYAIYYDIILFFGLTELKAQIGWKESDHGEIKHLSRMYVVCDQQQQDNL